MAFQVKPEAALASWFGNILQDMHPIFNSKDLVSFWDIDGELKTLEKRLKRIQDVLNDAEWRSQTEGSVSDWMDDLRELLYCIDDFVDDMNIERMRKEKQLAVRNQAAYTAQKQIAALEDAIHSSPDQCATQKQLEEELKSLNHQAPQVSVFEDIQADYTPQKKTISGSIKKIIVKLEEVAKDAKELNLKPQTLAGTPVASFAVRDGEDIGPLVDESEIYGRQEDKDHVIEFLMSPSDSSRNYSVVSIVGMGGVGKTTLARLVFDQDERVKNYFGMQSWACVSDDFDFSRVVRELIEYISKEKTSKMTTAALVDRLNGMVAAKKVLFVLDDIWTVEAWEKLKGVFTHCARGSKILVTTRDKNIGNAINDREIHKLQTLEDKHCCVLFKEKAFRGVVDERLEKIGTKIVERCKGVPLAVKVIGSSLRFAPKEMWENTLKNKMWQMMDVPKDGIFRVLKLSYHYLPSSLKRCFQYLSVFPTDYQFERENLVRLWIAEGLIESTEGGTLTDIGRSYYIELQRRYLIQEDDRMHDLLHSLACLVSGKFFSCSVKGSKSYKNMGSIRHLNLSLIENKVKVEMFDQATCLRTLLVFEKLLFDKINLKWEHLRVLDLSGNDLSELPSSVEKLNHLRYLNLSGCFYLQSLPDSICELSNLQTLDLSYCYNIMAALPTDMGHLHNLRYLYLNEIKSLSALPNSIVKLSNLLTLDLNGCQNLTCTPDKIGDLRSLQILDLTGCDSLSHLPNGIGDLRDLRELRLGSTLISCLPESISNIHNLRALDISNCTRLNSLPYNIGNLTSIEKLGRFVVGREEGHGIEELKDMNMLRGKLTISHLENVHRVEHALMANLKKKVLDEIHFEWNGAFPPNEGVLDALEPHPTSLKALSFLNYRGGRIPKWLSASSFPILKVLVMKGLEGINKMVDVELLSLQSLEIESCLKLKDVSIAVPNLEILKVSSCRDLTTLSISTYLLRVLDISNCARLNSLPHNIGNLTSIEKLGRFFVGREEGHGIEVLKDMTKLQGELTISHLENIQSVEHALMANLKKKVLDEIHFEWSSALLPNEDDDISDVDRDLEARVLDALEPHPTSLEALSFLNYRGDRIPKWMSTLSFPILKKLVMKGLKEINRMVDVELPSLKWLEIESCIKLKDVSMGVPNLKVLRVSSCRDLTTLSMSPSLGNSSSSLASSRMDLSVLSQLKELKFSGRSRFGNIHMMMLPGLEDLPIEDCKELKMRYAHYMPNLWRLTLKSLPNLTLLRGLHDQGSLSSLASLKEPHSSLGCEHELISLVPPEEGGGMFPNLEYLDVQECPKLKFSPEGLRHLTSLQFIAFSCQLAAGKEASLQNLSRLEDMVITGFAGQVLPLARDGEAGSTSSSLPPKLKKLAIQNCPNLTILPKALHACASLRTLKIIDCPQLESFPETVLPPLLQVLRISSCKNLQYLPTGLGGHTSLQVVEIGNCDQVKARPDDPPNFSVLCVSECPKLEQQIKPIKQDREGIEQSGEAWLAEIFYALVHGTENVDDPKITGGDRDIVCVGDMLNSELK